MLKEMAEYLRFARQALMLWDKGAEDSIMLHYLVLLGEERSWDGKDVRFDTLL